MPDWLKTFVLIVGLVGWLATVLVALSRGELPDAKTLGIPAALVLAVVPPITIGRSRVKRGTQRRAVRPAAEADGSDES